jgi:hypothetical protein
MTINRIFFSVFSVLKYPWSLDLGKNRGERRGKSGGEGRVAS